MSSSVFLERSRFWLSVLEKSERAKGNSDDSARSAVARRLGVSRGSIETIMKNRRKSVATEFYEAIRAAVIPVLEANYQRAKHERDLATAAGLDTDDASVRALMGALETADEALRQIRAKATMNHNFGRREGRSDAAGGTG